MLIPQNVQNYWDAQWWEMLVSMPFVVVGLAAWGIIVWYQDAHEDDGVKPTVTSLHLNDERRDG
jgi:hypothetical protein